MKLMLILLSSLILIPTCVKSLKYCYEGTYEIERPDGYLECDLCPEGTYMPEYDHRHTACYNCTKTQSHLEVVASPCNRTHDTVITCVDGYYRDEARNPREKATCKKCTECQHTGRPCQTYNDTICCQHENSEVVLHQDGYLICKERPYLCRQGQYLDTSVNECLPCPSNTYMPSDLHVMTECWKCPHYNLPLHAEMIQSCNSTHAPVVACKKGFYMNHAMGYKDSSIGCSPCRDCNKASLYEGRACHGLHDTVCCPQPNMTVLDMPGGPLCEEPLFRIQTSARPPVMYYCGENEYLLTNSNDNSIQCQPCPRGTYVHSTRHTESSCEKCAEFKGEQLPSVCMQTTTESSTRESESINSMCPHSHAMRHPLTDSRTLLFSCLFIMLLYGFVCSL